MKSLILGAALLAAVIPASAQTNVSISIGEPGFYGRIDLGRSAPPPVVYAERPVVVERHVRYEAEPVYLRVPPGHRKDWARHCGRYNACGQRVLFVRDDWYDNSYAPRYRDDRRGERRDYDDEHHGKGHDKHHGKGHGKGHD